jgi:type II secretion system protein N
MMPGSTLVRRGGVLLALPTLFLLGVYFFFPSQRIEYELIKSLEEQRLSISPGLHKTFVPGLRWNNPVLSSDQGPLVKCDWIRFQPRLLPFFRGRMVVGASSMLGGGLLDADYGVTGKQVLKLHISGVALSEIPFFRTVLGARAGGTLWSEGDFTRSATGLNGELRLEVQQLQLSGVKLGAFPLPDVSNLLSRGMVRVTGNVARLESFTLQGNGVYMRLSGEIPTAGAVANAPLNLVLEIMPKPDFLDNQKLVFVMLAKFMVSPGVYRVPIRGTLLKPEIV